MRATLIIFLSISLFLMNSAAFSGMILDSNDNVGVGTPSPTAKMEVTGNPDEDALVGSGSGTGIGVYGINTSSGNYGILGDMYYGVYGHNPGGYAGYFLGNVEISGNLNVIGSLTGESIGDVTSVSAGTGLTGGGDAGDLTLSISNNYKMPQGCSSNQIVKWNGAAWTCSLETDPMVNGLAKASLSCSASNQVVKWNGAAWICATEGDPSVNTLAKASIPCTQNQIVKWNGSSWACSDDLATLQSELANLRGTVTNLQQDLADLADLLMHFSRQGTDIYIDGANLHVRNGNDATDAAINGLGNIIIGYNEQRATGNNRTGSHNLIIGTRNNYASFGGIITGEYNMTWGNYSIVLGGLNNEALDSYSSVVGGLGNRATGPFSAVVGGSGNTADGENSMVSGGTGNTSYGMNSVVSGGFTNIASGDNSAVSGGSFNDAGGITNEVPAENTSVSGGIGNTVTISGGWAGGLLYSPDPNPPQ